MHLSPRRSLIQPVARKKEFASIFGGALACTLVMYTALGLAAAWRLGDDVDPSCNLNWNAYRNPVVGSVRAAVAGASCSRDE